MMTKSMMTKKMMTKSMKTSFLKNKKNNWLKAIPSLLTGTGDQQANPPIKR
jgi:hypothetical protein